MQFFLNQVTIIGLGLMGSSIARGLKEWQLARRVVGCSQSADTLHKARELGIIDSAVTNAADSVRRSELVILCTPLSTYGAIASVIAPQLKTTAILTDVGSVKKTAIDSITAHLRRGQIFIPSHPIAGSEKSGVEAGSAALFEKKKVIFTPAAHHHSQAACDKLTHLWNTLGATTEIMEASKHDRIYGAISHAVQLLSSAYASSISTTCPPQELAKNAAFTGFVRLAGSNTSMWGDIFASNHQPIRQALHHFQTQFTALLSLIEQENTTALCDTLEKAAQERARHKDTEPLEAPKRSYAADNPLFACSIAVPLLIACAAFNAFPYADYAGSGFWGFTQLLREHQTLNDKRLISHKEHILQVAHHFLDVLHIMQDGIDDISTSPFTEQWGKSQDLYQKLHE